MEEAVADVDVVVEVVEVVVVAVVLVHVLDGGDGLVTVERGVAVGLHGWVVGEASRVRVFCTIQHPNLRLYEEQSMFL